MPSRWWWLLQFAICVCTLLGVGVEVTVMRRQIGWFDALHFRKNDSIFRLVKIEMCAVRTVHTQSTLVNLNRNGDVEKKKGKMMYLRSHTYLKWCMALMITRSSSSWIKMKRNSEDRTESRKCTFRLDIFSFGCSAEM